jgi:hypothetical protein
MPSQSVANPTSKSNSGQLSYSAQSAPMVPTKRLGRSRQAQNFNEFLIECRELSTRHLQRESRELHNLQLEIAACLGAVNCELARRKEERALAKAGGW